MSIKGRRPAWKVKVACWTSPLVALGIALLLAGCSHGTAQAVVNTVPLQRNLEAEFRASNADFDLHDGTALSVTLFDSPANDLTWGQRADRARQIAESVCKHCESLDSYDRARVAFEARRDEIVGDASSSVAFSFEKSELECGDR